MEVSREMSTGSRRLEGDLRSQLRSLRYFLSVAVRSSIVRRCSLL
jgi:hypothetical protein